MDIRLRMTQHLFIVPFVEPDLVEQWRRFQRGEKITVDEVRLSHSTSIEAANEVEAARKVEHNNPGFVAVRDGISRVRPRL